MKLREFNLDDAERLAELVGDKSISAWTANIPYPYTVSDAEKWIKEIKIKGDRHPFAVELSGEIVACVSYWTIGTDTIEIGYWVGKKYWGKGVATSALTLLLSCSFFPKTSKVIAKILDRNIRSERVLLKCGFVFSGNCVVLKEGKELSGRYFVKSNES